MSALIWQPVIEPALLAALGLAALATAMWRATRRGRAAASEVVRIVGILSLLIIAMGPMQMRSEEIATPPSLAILIDGSRSMAIEDEGGLGRLESIRRAWLNVDAMNTLTADRATTLQVIGETSASVVRSAASAIDPDRDETALHAALSQAIDRAPPGSVVLAMTDGIETVERESRLDELGALAAARSIRLDAVVPGSLEAAPDVRVIARATPPIVYEGQTSEIVVDVISVGVDAELLELVVRDMETEDAVVHRQRFEPGPLRQFRAPVRPRSAPDGAAMYEIAVSGASNEAHLENNTRTVVIDVINDAAKVVVFEARPYWETSFLIDALRADPQVDVTSVLALTAERDVVRTSGRAGGADAPAPDWSTLGVYDVVVLGRGVERWFGGHRAAALRRFVVDQGGAIVFLRGDPVEGDGPDAELLRAVIDSMSPVVFGEGRSGAGTLGLTAMGRADGPLQGDAAFNLEEALVDLPGVLSTTVVESEKALATVWLRRAPELSFGERAEIRADDPPALAVLRVGAGRTMAVLSDGLWRWAMAPQASAWERAIYGQFWSRLVRWLALGGEFTPGRALSVSVSDGPHAPGDVLDIEVRARQPLSGASPNVSVIAPDGRIRPLAAQEIENRPLTWQASFTAHDEGVYEIRVADGAAAEDQGLARVAVHEHRREILDVTPRRDRMRRMVEASGGQVWAIDDVNGFFESLDSRRGDQIAKSLDAAPLWDSGWVFALVAGFFGAAWLLERWERLR